MTRHKEPSYSSERARMWQDNGLAAAGLDPSAALLFETLVSRPTLLHRNSVPYVAIRRWRCSVKPFQIDALRILKQNPPPRFVSAIVDDILAALDPMIGSALYRYIVPVPCSRSAPNACLSTLLAEKLASRLQLITVHALSVAPAEGSSHPKANVTRAPMRLLEPVNGPVMVVDDVATSGAHIEEAVRLLRPSAKAVFAVSWIGGAPDNNQGGVDA